MHGSLTTQERAVRGVLGVCLVYVAFHVGLGSSATEPLVLAWGALVLALVALSTAALGSAGPLARTGLDRNWSVGLLAARLYVGWEFLHAGWEKARSSWFSGGGTDTVRGTLSGAVASSHASATNPYPPVAGWAGSVAHALLPHAELFSYLVVTGELCIGIGLILGLFLRLSAALGVMLNSVFMFAGALGAGLNPEMVLLGMTVALVSTGAVYALAADRVLLPRLRGGLRLELAHGRTHAPVSS